MKKILSLLLALALLLSMAACSEPSGKKEAESKEESVESLSAKELYEKGKKKNEALTSAKYLTEIFFGEEKIDQITTVRVREGYDGFSYSRSGKDFYAFADGKAYLKTADGAFSAPSTSRAFAEYMESYLFPIYGFSSEQFSEAQREGNTVRYSLSEKAALSLYSSVLPAEKGAFLPELISGSASFDEEAILVSEEYTVSGGEKSIRIKTVLEEFRNSKLAPALPAEGEAFLELEDIRLPQMIASATDALLSLSTVQATVVRSESFSLSKGKFSLHRDLNLYQTGAGDGFLYYRSLQSLKQIPEKEEESRFHQKRVQGNSFVQNEYNLITAQKLSEESGTATPSWSEDVAAVLPAFSDFGSLSVEEDSSSIGIRFSLSNAASERIVSASAALFPEMGAVSAVEPGTASGTLLIEKESGRISALSFNLSASALCGEEKGSFSGEFSVTIDQTESITLPELQVPTPTTPGMQSDNAPVC